MSDIIKRLNDAAEHLIARADLGDMGRKPSPKDRLRIIAAAVRDGKALIEQQAREIARLDTMLTGYQLAMQEQLEIRQRNEAKIEELNIALTNVGSVVDTLTSDGDDAARYRWLRDHSCPPHNFYISVPDEFHGVRYAPGDVDAYIDAARAALEKSNVE